MEDTLKFYDFKNSAKGRGRIDGNCCRVSVCGGNYFMTFPKAIVAIIDEKNASCIRLASNTLTGEWFMVFSQEGLEVRRQRCALRVSNKQMVEFIKSRIIKQKADKFVLTLSEDKSTVANVATFKIEGFELVEDESEE